MAKLDKQQLLDLMVEEKQILLTVEQASSERHAAKQTAEQAYLAALHAADAAYVTATQAAESRLLDLRAQLTQDGKWDATRGSITG